MYGKINGKILNNLESVSGRDALLTSSDLMEGYAADESGFGPFIPDAVIRPETSEEALEIIRLCASEKIPVTPRGGGTGLSGGALPVYGGLLISFERMNKIIDIDIKNRMAVLEPGVVNAVLQEEAEKEGLFYPVNPASMDSCTLGGNVAESAGGANTVRYGTTRNYLSGLKAVTGNSEILSAGGRVFKNASDQILMQLLCGSEGTLGLFTEITIRLIRKPTVTYWILAPFKKLLDIPAAALKILSSELNPTMVEIMDSFTLECAEKFSGERLGKPGEHYLMIRFDGDDSDRIEEEASRAADICLESGAGDILAAESPIEQKRLWSIRSGVHEAIQKVAGSVCEEDIVVPVSMTKKMIEEALIISEEFKLPAAVFGHLGDGNLHINYTCGEYSDNNEIPLEILKDRIFSAAVALGGKISGEHGIGMSKKIWFKKHTDRGYINTLKKVKEAFDPQHIINPGKML